MRLYRWLSDFHPGPRPIALAIGNFDGFHIGHQAVIAKMQEKAQQMQLQSAVMIFEPQPLEFFGKNVPPRLFSLRDKLRIFRAAGVENVFCMSFTRQLAGLTDVDFVAMLKEKLNVQSVTVGSLFSFGRKGAYTIDDLVRRCEEQQMECSAIEGVEDDGVRISSTLIRTLLSKGDFRTAERFMGHAYTMAGRVVHGNAIGRTLGFPTANININRRVCPLAGVYAVRIATHFGVFNGIANIGHRPTIANPLTSKLVLEVNIFDFKHDIYGQDVEIFFIHKIRDERKFTSLDELKMQLDKDRKLALSLLA